MNEYINQTVDQSINQSVNEAVNILISRQQEVTRKSGILSHKRPDSNSVQGQYSLTNVHFLEVQHL